MSQLLWRGGKCFQWPEGCPKNQDDFEKLMWAVDAFLDELGFEPMWRPSKFSDCFLDASLWSGGQAHSDDALADQPGYEGAVLIAKGHQWYREVYGNTLTMDWNVASVPIRLGNAIWNLRLPRPFGIGAVDGFLDRNLTNIGVDYEGRPLQENDPIGHGCRVNCLNFIRDFPQGLASRLTDAQLDEFTDVFRASMAGVSALIGLFMFVNHGDENLFYTAFRDYASSTDNLLRFRLPQSRWDASQAAEKIIKGFIKVRVGNFEQTHNLDRLANTLGEHLSNPIERSLLDHAFWPPNGRYAEKDTSVDESLLANHAVLKIVKHLAEDHRTKAIIDEKNRKG